MSCKKNNNIKSRKTGQGSDHRNGKLPEAYTCKRLNLFPPSVQYVHHKSHRSFQYDSVYRADRGHIKESQREKAVASISVNNFPLAIKCPFGY